MIDWTKPLVTDEDDPRPVRILATGLRGRRDNIVLLVEDDDKDRVYTVDQDNPSGLYPPLRNTDI